MQFFACAVLLISLAYGGSRLHRHKTGLAWLEHLFGTGIVFCVIGFLLGPEGTGVIDRMFLRELQPLVILSLGWVGFLVGMQADLSLLYQVPRRYVLGMTLESGLTILAITVVSAGVFYAVGISGSPLVLLSLTMGACAGVSSQAIPVLAGRKSPGKESTFLRIATGLDDFPTVAIAIVLFSFVGKGGAVTGFPVGMLWLGVTLCLGLGFGLLFYLLLRPRARFDETMAICLGVTILSSGAAAYLDLAVPGIGFLAGFFVANIPIVKKQTFYNVLTLVERPIVFFMFLMAGAHLYSREPWWLIPLAAYVLVRAGAKITIGNVFGKRLPGESSKAGWGLVASGPFSIAVALDYATVQGGPHGDALLWIVTAGAVIGDLMVPVALRHLQEEQVEA